MERLDKFFSSNGILGRKETRVYIREGKILVNGVKPSSWDMKVDSEVDVITLCGERVKSNKEIVIMMNKPKGYVTSTDDPISPTVMSLLPSTLVRKKVYPIGRLDKDTEGLLLFTNDGELSHRLISPKSNIEKEYYIEHSGTVTEEIIEEFKNGIMLKDGTTFLPSVLKPIEKGKSLLVIREGKYHQVRRMMAHFGLDVLYLKRVREASLELGDLERGEIRELGEEEKKELYLAIK